MSALICSVVTKLRGGRATDGVGEPESFERNNSSGVSLNSFSFSSSSSSSLSSSLSSQVKSHRDLPIIARRFNAGIDHRDDKSRRDGRTFPARLPFGHSFDVGCWMFPGFMGVQPSLHPAVIRASSLFSHYGLGISHSISGIRVRVFRVFRPPSAVLRRTGG